jgi:peroxiredoxin
MAIEIGQPAPAFSLPDTNNEQVTLESLRGNKTLLVFIPFPFTGVCTDELCELQENLGQLQELGANVVAITCDTRFSNDEWARREGIEYPVLSDYWPHGETSKAYGVFNDTFGAAMRSTFVLNAKGTVTDMIRSEEILVARQFEDYLTALSN